MAEPKKEESERTENIVALSVFAGLVLIVVALFTNGFGLFNRESAGVDLSQRFTVPVEGDPVRGDMASSKVVIVAFSDFECPFCQRGEQTITSLFQKYNGQVVLVFKNFPLTTIHPNAFNSALAAECAREQEKFWEYHDMLFSHNQALSVPDLKAYAGQLGLDQESFDVCLDSQRYASDIQIDTAIGRQLGVSSTPTFFINGLKLVGSQPESEFVKVIESELSK